MGYAIPICRIGTYVLNELMRVRDAFTEAPDDGPITVLRRAEISVAFATEDGLPIQPPLLVVGDEPIPPDEIARRLEGLDRKVFVTLVDVNSSNAASRGQLILRVAF